MDPEEAASLALRLAAELSAALPARRSAVEFARHFIGDAEPGLKRALIELRSSEARLTAAADAALDNVELLARLAVTEATALEAEVARLEAWLKPDASNSGPGRVRIVAGLLWEARYGEGRARASLSARRKRQALSGFDEALELAPEDELLFLALRRFSRLLHAGTDWPTADHDWLRLRAATLPGRLRLHAAELRSLAELGGGIALPEDLVELRRPFIQFGFEPGPALAWGVAGFSLSEALVWGAAGLPWAAQAQAWKAWGHSAAEAAGWVAADLLPDEAAAFKACGATDAATARQLRQALGDVEHLLAWHRAGFDTAEVLKLRAEGVTDVEAASKARQAAAKETARLMMAEAAEAPTPGAAASRTASTEAGDAPRTADDAPKRKPKAPQPEMGSEGGAWMGWAVFEPGPSDLEKPRDLTRSRALGGGVVDVVSASEGVALESLPYATPALDVDPEWQAQLDWHRQALGREAQPGQWLLAALPPLSARLYWGLLFKTPASPWGTAIDFDATETWAQRWKRRAEEWGEAGAVCPCEVGRTPSGGWFVEAKGSRMDLGSGELRRLDRLQPGTVWQEAVDSFCLTMGIGKQAPAWCLLAVPEP